MSVGPHPFVHPSRKTVLLFAPLRRHSVLINRSTNHYQSQTHFPYWHSFPSVNEPMCLSVCR
uniref:Uncharacterized protein n=1 Tax=Picea sitchensis TaxID=3332 RepID=A0A6B9XW05_PICSI|nr:hypothetical protein Q903MT_gene4209 [Picea sitchensis]